jgi:hypothetical protein
MAVGIRFRESENRRQVLVEADSGTTPGANYGVLLQRFQRKGIRCGWLTQGAIATLGWSIESLRDSDISRGREEEIR